jgi:hypothetical protein
MLSERIYDIEKFVLLLMYVQHRCCDRTVPRKLLCFGNAMSSSNSGAEAMSDVVEAGTGIDTGFLSELTPCIGQQLTSPGGILFGQERMTVRRE